MESCREIFSSAARKARPSQRFLRHAATMRGATAHLYRSRPDRHRRALRRRRCPRANAFDARRAATQIVAVIGEMNESSLQRRSCDFVIENVFYVWQRGIEFEEVIWRARVSF